jgi:hypothetical protein
MDNVFMSSLVLFWRNEPTTSGQETGLASAGLLRGAGVPRRGRLKIDVERAVFGSSDATYSGMFNEDYSGARAIGSGQI